MNAPNQTATPRVRDLLIDRAARERLAKAMEDFLSSKKSFWGPWRFSAALRSVDPAIGGVSDLLSEDLDDDLFPEDSLERFPPQTLDRWRRAIAFLRTDLPYVWPVRDTRKWSRSFMMIFAFLAVGMAGTFLACWVWADLALYLIGFWLAAGIAAVVVLGVRWNRVNREWKRALTSEGDQSYWPFRGEPPPSAY